MKRSMLALTRTVVTASWILVILLLWGAGAAPPTGAQGGGTDAQIELEGLVDVPGGPLSLPPAAPVTVIVSFGVPAFTVPVAITPTTTIQNKDNQPLPATIGDGDRVRIEANVVGGVVQAVLLRVEDFPELAVHGSAQGVPPGGISIPLSPGSPPVNFQVQLGATGILVPVQVSAVTKARDNLPFTLQNGALVEVDTVARGGVIFATEIHLE